MNPCNYYSRMFPKLPAANHSEDNLIALASLMVDDTPKNPPMVMGPNGPEPAKPAERSLISGLLYYAQFVDHDVSLDRTPLSDAGKVPPEDRLNWRSPFLDLDSLYGGGPEVSPALYYLPLKRLTPPGTLPGHERFLIGPTTPSLIRSDLPRTEVGKPIIADPRNEENLILAQLHVLMLQFHNKVIAALEDRDIDDVGLTGTCFSKAQRLVTWHYQYILMHDLLDVLLDRTILNNAITSAAPLSAIPIEFALAGFRVGHSMIRNSYQINLAHEEATLKELLNLNSLGVPPLTRLPDEWIIDWARFFDGLGAPPAMQNRSHGLDTLIAKALHHLSFPTPIGNKRKVSSLPAITLLRGNRSGLPSGQDVARKMGETPLRDDEMEFQQAIPIMDALKRFGWLRHTPLWFYLLQEACVCTQKEGLGPVGNRLIAKTIVGLLKEDRNSILKQGNGWTPPVWKSRGIAVTTMSNLVKIVTGLT